MITIPIFSAWILMLILGAIGHQANEPRLFFSYWLTLLSCMALYTIGWLVRGGDK